MIWLAGLRDRQQLGAFGDLIADREVDLLTTPSSGALMVCSIFMASRIMSGAPTVTRSPAWTRTLMMLPGIGAVRLPLRTPRAGPRATGPGPADGGGRRR